MSSDLSSFGTGVHPSPPANMRGVEREGGRGPTVQIRPAHNDSYLPTFRLYKHLHIQKSSSIFPGLHSVCLHVHPCTGKVARMWQQCVGGGRQQFICVPCVSVAVCYMCNTLLSVKRDWNQETHVAMCNNIAEFVFDYCTRLRSW